MRNLIAAAALGVAAFLLPGLAHAQQAAFANYSASVAGTPVQVIKAGQVINSWIRVWNVSTAAVAWCSWSTISPAANAAGSWPLQPGQYELLTVPGPRALGNLYCIGSGGTAALTLEAN